MRETTRDNTRCTAKSRWLHVRLARGSRGTLHRQCPRHKPRRVRTPILLIQLPVLDDTARSRYDYIVGNTTREQCCSAIATYRITADRNETRLCWGATSRAIARTGREMPPTLRASKPTTLSLISCPAMPQKTHPPASLESPCKFDVPPKKPEGQSLRGLSALSQVRSQLARRHHLVSLLLPTPTLRRFVPLPRQTLTQENALEGFQGVQLQILRDRDSNN